MRFLLSSAVQEDLRVAIEYYRDTAGDDVAADFNEEFLRYAVLAAESPKA